MEFRGNLLFPDIRYRDSIELFKEIGDHLAEIMVVCFHSGISNIIVHLFSVKKYTFSFLKRRAVCFDT